MSNYTKDENLQANDEVLGTDSTDGKTVNFPLYALKNYIENGGGGLFQVFDGATDLDPFSLELLYVEQNIRLGLTGDLTETQFFPVAYGNLLVNDDPDPAGTQFDFRFLPQATFIRFFLNCVIHIDDTSGDFIDPATFVMRIKFTYPNGSVDVRDVIIESTYFDTIGNEQILDQNVNLEFSTYIKDPVMDSFLGGNISVVLLSQYDVPPTANVEMRDLVINLNI